MCGLEEEEEEEEAGECSQTMHNASYATQEQIFLQQMQQQNNDVFAGGGRSSGLIFPEVSPILPWTFPAPVHNFNPLHFPTNPDPFLLPPPPPPPSQTYGGFFNRRQQGINPFGYEDGTSSDHHHLRLISDSMGQVVQPGLGPFSLQAEMMSKMSAQEIMDAKALAASKSHSEAERRRRERINNHLAKLRSLLPNTTKTDKASLLAEVIQHVKELRHQTSVIAETCPIPTETDELTVDNASDENGTFLIKASLCCEDRSDLMPELIKTLKQLRLKTLKAEITTLGGRVKNVLFITWDEDHLNVNEEQQYSISSIQQALKSVMERTNSTDDSPSGSVKRQRTNINIL